MPSSRKLLLTLVFPKDERGNQQSWQWLIRESILNAWLLKGWLRLMMMKEAIKQMGLEEAQKSLNESLEQDADLCAGSWTSRLQRFSDNFEWERAENDFHLWLWEFDIEKAASMPYFQNLKLKEMIKLTPEEYHQLPDEWSRRAEIICSFLLHFNDRVTIWGLTAVFIMIW